MAKLALLKHPKFLKLVRRLSVCEAQALGHLELLWHAGYQTGDPRVGGTDDVEVAAKWVGGPGVLANALQETGFIDRCEDGKYEIHDLMQHAPKFVKDRLSLRRRREQKKNRVAKPKRTTVKPARTWDSRKAFDEFWAEYPRKQAKQLAAKSWRVVVKDAETFKAVMKGLANWKATEQWARNIIPHPSSWLRANRWEDELAAPPASHVETAAEYAARMATLHARLHGDGKETDSLF